MKLQKTSTSLRLPIDAKAFIEAEAAENASSQNSEIVRAIRERMKAKGAARGATLPRQIQDQPKQKDKANEQA